MKFGDDIDDFVTVENLSFLTLSLLISVMEASSTMYGQAQEHHRVL